MMYFNPRSREGSDISAVDGATVPEAISIHAPAKGATRLGILLHLCPRFQSTLPRRERPSACDEGIYLAIISIHAPAKGATWDAVEEAERVLTISIHAPAKGATARA